MSIDNNGNSPAGEIMEAAIKTVCNPSIPVLAEDLLLAHQLATDLKEKLDGKHDSVWEIVQWLFRVS